MPAILSPFIGYNGLKAVVLIMISPEPAQFVVSKRFTFIGADPQQNQCPIILIITKIKCCLNNNIRKQTGLVVFAVKTAVKFPA